MTIYSIILGCRHFESFLFIFVVLYCLFLTLYLCTVSVVVGLDAELDESSVVGVGQTEGRIISQWGEVSADEQHQLRERVDEIFRPLGLQTRLIVLERANSIVLYFICMTLAAIMGLHDQWSSGQLRVTIESLFTLLSGATQTVHVKRLTLSHADYQRCSEAFNYVEGEGKQMILIIKKFK